MPEEYPNEENNQNDEMIEETEEQNEVSNDEEEVNNPDDYMGKVNTAVIEDEMKKSYLDYAMSVIVARALPDVRDGLKPVHRRILYAMNDMGMYHKKPYKKTDKIVG